MDCDNRNQMYPRGRRGGNMSCNNGRCPGNNMKPEPPCPCAPPPPPPPPMPRPQQPRFDGRDGRFETHSENSCQNGCASTGGSIQEVDRMPIAMGYVPWQIYKDVFDPGDALKMGTAFPELVKPFLRTGGCGR